MRNFYSVSISGYHIAEAGANPISQLAFTLANGFTYVEAFLARGMAIDDFAPNLSFFATPHSWLMIIWIAMARRTESSVGVVIASSYAFVCSELVLS